MTFKRLLTTVAFFSLVNACVAMVMPEAQLRLYGILADQGAAYMARWAGLGSLAIGLLAWLSRRVTDPPAQRAYLLGLLGYLAAGAALSVLGVASHTTNGLGWILAAIDAAFAAACAVLLSARR